MVSGTETRERQNSQASGKTKNRFDKETLVVILSSLAIVAAMFFSLVSVISR